MESNRKLKHHRLSYDLQDTKLINGSMLNNHSKYSLYKNLDELSNNCEIFASKNDLIKINKGEVK
jgi:uncharacterized protein with WD repeat